MAKVQLGNHTAVYVAKSERERLRQFYGGVLGCRAGVLSDAVDRFDMEGVHFVFVYQDTALEESAFLRAIYLELKTDDLEGTKQAILGFGVKTVDIPDPHLYFQAPGGQVFKLVAATEDLTVYERSASSRPGAAATGVIRLPRTESFAGAQRVEPGG
jgi:catechol 2,3-dioxygenase-like lactoylglutathione lyase family enzyme